MTTQIARRDATGPLTISSTQEQLVRDTICRGATEEEFRMFVAICNRTQLDPFARQIYAIKRWDSNLNREVMATQTSIDGFRLTAQRSGEHMGTDDAEYDSEDDSAPQWARVTVYRHNRGVRCAYTAKARLTEYMQTKKNGEPTSMWRKMPYLMLAKCAEALALRKAFPAELSGLCTNDEMGQADNAEVIPPPREARDAGPVTARVLAKLAPPQAPALSEILLRIEAAQDTTDLGAIEPDAKRISGPDKDAARAAYVARRDALTARAGHDYGPPPMTDADIADAFGEDPRTEEPKTTKAQHEAEFRAKAKRTKDEPGARG